MLSHELGRIGLVLLGVSFLLESLLSMVSTVSTLAEVSVKAGTFPVTAIAVFLPATLVVVVLVGIVPATILIRTSDRLARRWFPDDTVAPVATTFSELVRVGLVLLGVYFLMGGAIGVLGALVGVSVFRGDDIAGAAGATWSLAIDSVGHLVGGLLLLRLAEPLSKRWGK